MYPYNYFIILGVIFSFVLLNRIYYRRDIEEPKITVIIFLYSVAFLELSYFLFLETSLQNNFKWFIIYIFFYLYFIYFFFFYFIEDYIESYFYRLLYPIILLLLITILTYTALVVLMPKSAITIGYQIIIELIELQYPLIISLVMWVIIFINLFIGRRFYLLPIAILSIVLNLMMFGDFEKIFYYYNIIHFPLLIYTPWGIFFDFMKRNHYHIFSNFEYSAFINNCNFGIITKEYGNKYFINKFMRKFFNKQGVDGEKWIYENEKYFSDIGYEFTKKELSIGNKTYYFFIRKEKYKTPFLRNDVIIFFDATKTTILEKITEQYERSLSEISADNIIKINVRKELTYTNEFLKGFAHNSFNLISVIKTGMDYMRDKLDELEKIIFAESNLNKQRKALHETYNIIDRTINLSFKGIVDIQKSFYLLNNKVKNIVKKERVLFSIKDFIDQEIFFYIYNTHYKYDIRVNDIYKQRDDIEISTEYNILSSVFHSLLEFIISRMNTMKINEIIIDMEESIDTKGIIIIKSKDLNVNMDKVKKILYSNDYSSDNEYINLIDAAILMKTHNFDIDIEGDNKKIILKIILK